MNEDFNEFFAKQQSDQQRIDQNGVRLFASKLPGTDRLSVPFNEQGSNDFGIDGEIQILINKKITGEKFKVQIKSTEHIKYINKGSKVSFSLDLRSAYSLVKIEKVPTALVVVDNVNERVFWLAIQVDDIVKTSLEKKLKKKDNDIAKTPSVTIHVSTDNELTKDSFLKFYEDLKKSALALAKNELVSTKEKSLITGIKHLQAIEDRILELEGFTPYSRNKNDSPNEKTVMSVNIDSSRSIDYIPNSDYRPELAPEIKIQTKFKMTDDEDRKRAESFQNVLSNGIGEVTLRRENITLFTAKSGKTLIDSLEQGGDLMITISPAIRKRKQTLILRSGEDELQVMVNVWVQGDEITIESLESELINLRMKIPSSAPYVGPSGIDIKVTLGIRKSLILSASHELRLMRFARSANEMTIYFLGDDGFKNKLMNTSNLRDSLNVPQELFELIVMLTEIEARSGRQIIYPLPERITPSMAEEVERVHASFFEGFKIRKGSLKLGIHGEFAPQPMVGDVIQLAQTPAVFELFGNKYTCEKFEYKTIATMSQIETISEDSYTHRIDVKDGITTIRPLGEGENLSAI